MIQQLIFLISLVFVLSQTVNTRIYTENDGLISRQISDVIEDNDGLIWVAHGRGISRFDGFKWDDFPQSLNLPVKQTRLAKTANGGILAFGLGLYSWKAALYENGKWSFISLPDSLGDNKLFAFNDLIKDQFFLSGNNGLFHYSLTDQSWRTIEKPESLKEIPFRLLKYAGGELFVFVKDRIIRLNSQSGEFHTFLEGFNRPLDIINLADSYYILGNNWLCRWTDGRTDLLLNNFIQDGNFDLAQLKVKQNHLYFRSTNYIHRYDLNNQNHSLFKTSGVEMRFGNSLLYFDHQDNLWITSFRGLMKIPSFRFTNYTSKDGFLEDEVSTIIEISRNRFLMGANNSYSFFKDGQIESHTLIYKKPERPSGISRINDAVEMNGQIFLISDYLGLGQLDNKQIIWSKPSDLFHFSSVAEFNGKLYVSHGGGTIFNYQNGRFRKVLETKKQTRKIRQVNGQLYLLGNTGLGIWDGKNYRFISSRNSNFTDIYAVSIINDSIYLGTIGGLCKLVNDSIVEAGLSGHQINHPIYQILVNNDDIWIGSDKGVYLLQSNQLKHYYSEQGLIGNEINRNAMIRTSNGEIYIGTDRGLSIYNAVYDSDDKPIPRVALITLSTKTDVMDLNSDQHLEPDNRTLTFSYRAVSFYNEDMINYRIRLDGFDSDWISINTAEQRQYTYTNLPYGGPYYFTIQARSADGEWSEPVRSGAIRLDYPFYLTWWFLAVVILMIALLGYWINGYFNQSRINVLLQQKIDEKMAEVEEANQRVLIQNRQLKQEISERKRIEEERELFVRELENKNKELERYTYTISHDLKSPIITIKGYLGLLSDYAKQSDLENIVANIPVIAKAADTMFQLLDDLISITKIEKTEQQLSEFAMYDVLDETKELLASRLKEEEVEITVSSELPVIIADKKRLIEVMKNLLDNAIKYRNKNKRLKISITCLENGQHHLFAVSDNGLGIDMKYKDKIFGIFERLNQAIDGTGIGLAIVKSIIESHKGSVWVESDGPGKGSTFYFTIPRSV